MIRFRLVVGRERKGKEEMKKIKNKKGGEGAVCGKDWAVMLCVLWANLSCI